VGGAAVGGIAGGLLLQLSIRLLFHRPVPPRPLKMVRWLSGAALGLLVWFWVFSTGTGGLGGGGGWWPFGGKGGQAANSGTAATKKVPDQQEAPPNPVLDKNAKTLRIEILGGRRVVEQRFYVLEKDALALDLEQLKQAVQQRRERDSEIKGLTLVLFPDSVDQDNPAVVELKRWANDKGLAVAVSLPP
jgi:hypothetical protein